MSEQNQNKQKDFLTARQLADVLQISLSTVHRLRRQGRIPAVMVTSRLIRFNLRDVRNALATQQNNSSNTNTNTNTTPLTSKLGQQLAFEDLFTETFD
ncbi:MAG: helix-turn-helix domain-containing protein [Acidobacteria bacterium]|nr:helix-turn-helix domain-containing protein [Acidobacteriota bacterium]